MKLPNGTILKHAEKPYDPVKAHEYYLRTRKLKGRKAGQKEKLSLRFEPDSTYSVDVGNGKTLNLSSKQLKEQRLYAAKRVESIKKKLALLNTELKKRISEARKAEIDAKRAELEANKPKSAAEKAKAARDAEKYRDKHKQELKSKSRKAAAKEKAPNDSKPDSVEELKSKIADVKKSLDAAVKRQRSLISAKKNG